MSRKLFSAAILTILLAGVLGYKIGKGMADRWYDINFQGIQYDSEIRGWRIQGDCHFHDTKENLNVLSTHNIYILSKDEPCTLTPNWKQEQEPKDLILSAGAERRI